MQNSDFKISQLLMWSGERLGKDQWPVTWSTRRGSFLWPSTPPVIKLTMFSLPVAHAFSVSPRAIGPNSEKLAPCLAVRTRSTSHSTHHVSHGRESKTQFKRKSSHRCKKQTSVANGPSAPGLPQTSVRDQNVIVICNKQEQLAVVCPPIAPW